MNQVNLGPLMIDIEGQTLTSADQAVIAQPEVGGLIIFGRNYQSRRQLSALIAQIRQCQPGILIAVDQEGGRVQRLRDDGFTRIPPMQSLGEAYQQDKFQALAWAEQLGWLMASEVLAMDIDISFAPVLDVDFDYSSIIGDRSFSGDSAVVTALAARFMQGMQTAGMATTGKHYPGHGAVVEDSHLTLPVDKRNWLEIAQKDLKPFVQLQPQLDALMPAHIIFEQVDTLPVGFSPTWLQLKLRQQQGFDGVIFSDDLSMEGAVCAGGYAERTAAALNAGCDMVLVCNNRAGALEALEYLQQEKVQRPDSSRRLNKMRARKKPSWQSLQQDAAWTQAGKVADTLLTELNKG